MGVEKKLEKRCVDIAKAHGWYTRKWASPSHRGVPDRIFLKDGAVVFVEFKSPGRKPTLLQADEIEQIEGHGGKVFWVDDVVKFKVRMGIYT